MIASFLLQTLKNSKSLCSLDFEDDDDDEGDDAQIKTIVSSPCDSNDLMNITTPSSSLEKEQLSDIRHPDSHQASFSTGEPKEAAVVCESGEETSDPESTEEGIFPLDCEGLDLEQIENNWGRGMQKSLHFHFGVETWVTAVSLSVHIGCLRLMGKEAL